VGVSFVTTFVLTLTVPEFEIHSFDRRELQLIFEDTFSNQKILHSAFAPSVGRISAGRFSVCQETAGISFTPSFSWVPASSSALSLTVSTVFGHRSETVETVRKFQSVAAATQLKLGVNEKLRFSIHLQTRRRTAQPMLFVSYTATRFSFP